jgi:hypothetical protein
VSKEKKRKESTRKRRKKEREMDEKERSKERGNKSALSYFIYSHYTLTVSTDSSTSRIIDSHNDQSDNLDATFYITSNRVCR